MESERLYYIGVVKSVITENDLTKEYGVIEADIPGVIEGIQAFPKRGEIDEPKPGDAILLLCLDPVLNSYWIYEKLKENDFVGFRSAGKMVDITPDYISVGIFDKDKEYKEDERPTLTSYLKLDSSGNIEIKTKGKVDLVIDGNTDINIKNGSTSVKSKGEVKVESSTKCEINSPEVKITGGMLQVNGSGTPTGMGCFCAIPVCPATGLPQTTTEILGT